MCKSPDSTDTSSPAPTDSRQASGACDSCSKKKIKCDRAKPRCNYCQHHLLDCTFLRVRRPRRQKGDRKLRISDLKERIKFIEDLLAERLNPETDGDHAVVQAARGRPEDFNDHCMTKPTERPSSPVDLTGHVSLTTHRVGDINLYYGVPFLCLEGQKWLTFRESHRGPDWLWQNVEHPLSQLPGTGGQVQLVQPTFPDREILFAYLQRFHDSEFGYVFPVIDTVLILETLQYAYQPSDADPCIAGAAKACIHAFLALRHLSDSNNEQLQSLDSEHSIAAASLLLPSIFSGKASTQAVDALIMLIISYFSCGSIQAVDSILSIAVRFLFALGAHLAPQELAGDGHLRCTDRSIRAANHHRNLFWICYTFDMDIAFRTGRPPIINDKSCDLSLPGWYLTQSMQHNAVWHLPSDLRLSLIKSKAYEKLYSPQALRKCDADLLRDIRELDDMLEQWRQSFPQDSRPPLSYSQDKAYFEGTSVGFFILRLEYHHCLTTIHQASSRCKIFVDNRLVQQGVNSSLHLALEASRSLLHYFRKAEQHLAPQRYWLIIFYPLSAKLTLFSNVLLNPASASAKEDMELLVEMLQHLKTRQATHAGKLSKVQAVHMSRVVAYVEELVDLVK